MRSVRDFSATSVLANFGLVRVLSFVDERGQDKMLVGSVVCSIASEKSWFQFVRGWLYTRDHKHIAFAVRSCRLTSRVDMAGSQEAPKCHER